MKYTNSLKFHEPPSILFCFLFIYLSLKGIKKKKGLIDRFVFVIFGPILLLFGLFLLLFELRRFIVIGSSYGSTR